MVFSRRTEAELIMTSTLFLHCILFGTLQVVTGTIYYDSSNYKIINDVAKCRGNLTFRHVNLNTREVSKLQKWLWNYQIDCAELGDDWEPAIVNSYYELRFLRTSFSQSCECYQIGGSTNDSSAWRLSLSNYFPNDSGRKKA